jgi:hypothetical protein
VSGERRAAKAEDRAGDGLANRAPDVRKPELVAKFGLAVELRLSRDSTLVRLFNARLAYLDEFDDLADEHERDNEAVNCDRLDQHHAEDEVREHRSCGSGVTCDPRGGVTRREALANATTEASQANREASTDAGARVRARFCECDAGKYNCDQGPYQQLCELIHDVSPSMVNELSEMID